MLVAMLSLLWSTPKAFAEWVYVNENVVPAAQMQPGKMYILESVSNTAAKNHYLTANNDNRKGLIDSTTVWIFEEAGTNQFTGEKEYVMRSVLGGYLVGGDVNSTVSDNRDDAIKFMLHGATDENAYYVVPATGDTIWFTTAIARNSSPGWTANSTTLANLESVEKLTGEDWAYPCYFLANWWTSSTAYWGYRDTNPWDLYEVEYNVDGAADLQAAIDEYEAAGYENYPHSDDQPYAFTTTAWNRLQTAYNNAIVAVSEDHTFDEYKAYEAALRGAMAALSSDESVTPMKEGYYYFVTAGACFINVNKDVRIYDDGSANIKWNIYPAYTDTTAYIWRMTAGTADGTWSIQDMSTGRFMDGTGVPSSTAVDFSIYSIGSGKVALRKSSLTGQYQYLHCNYHGSGSGTGAALTGWETSADASQWYIVPVRDQELIARLEAGLAQKTLNTKMAAALSTATSDSARAMVTGIVGTGLVTNGNQLFSNNMEQSEGSYADLIDGNYNTYFHTAWSGGSDVDDAYHYLQFNSTAELPSSVKIYWMRRNQASNANRPSIAVLSASADGNEWTMLGDTLRAIHTDTTTGAVTGVLPILPSQLTYFSDAFTVPSGMTKLRLTVYETRTGASATNPDGGVGATSPNYHHPFFTFSEFQVYPGTAFYGSNESNSQALRSDMAPVYQALVAAIATARGIATPTQQDIDALQTAIDNFEALWVDSTGIVNNISTANSLVENPTLGDEVGQFTQEAVDQLKAAITTAQGQAPYYRLTKVQYDAAADALQAAIDAFQNSMVVPTDGWYYIVSNVSETVRVEEGNNAQPTRGRVIYASGYDTGAGLSWGNTVAESEQNGRAIWNIKSLGNNTYALQNVAAGWYMGEGGGASTRILLSDTIVPYKFVSLGQGQIGLQPANGNPLVHAQWANHALVNWTSSPAVDSPCAWTFTALPETADEMKTFSPNRYYVVTVPYNTSEMPYATSADLSFYTIVGAEKSADGLTTAINLQNFSGDHLTAGQPVVMHVGENSEEGDVSVSMMLDHENNSTLVLEPSAQNGLHGALQTVALSLAGYGYFTSADSIQATRDDATRNISAQEGYITPQEITEIEGASTDLTLYIAGEGIGTVNGINTISVSDPKALVNVYTIDGVLVKKNVQAGNAANGLAKGLYIIGRTKVLVK